MNEKFKRFTIYNLFFLCAFCSLFMVLNLNSFADTHNAVLSGENGAAENPNFWIYTQIVFQYNSDNRTCVVQNGTNQAVVYSLSNEIPKTYMYYQEDLHGFEPSINQQRNIQWSSKINIDNLSYYYFIADVSTFKNFSASGIPFFSDQSSAIQYLRDGILPEIPFDETLKLDSFKVTSWQIGTSQLVFRSKFVVTWSDSRIANVQVKIVGTANSPATFEANQSPFKQKFYADNYVMKNGDVIHLTATPFKSNGEYGESLYYSIVYNDGLPSNWYRKLVNTPYNDNTITIPYTNVSSQPTSVTLPVDGVTTNKVYKVNYNPVTYEYGDINLYEIYYSPVVVYPDDTPEEEIDETQEVVNNTYTTNNYYETTKNINFDFDVSFGDIDGTDITNSYDDFGDFGDGFGGFISKLSSWVLALFPFLSPVVASSIVVVFGLVIGLAVICFALKIASVIADFIDAVLPF